MTSTKHRPRAKIAHRLRLLKSYLRRRETCPGLPLYAAVSSTSRCNLRCPMCPRAISEFGNQDIDFDLFTRIVDEGAPYFECVVPYGGGEPLLNPRIFDMIRYCRERGACTLISTNATLLDAERTEALLDSGLDYLILAFDGTTPEVYEKYRVGADFHVTRNNILRFLERKVARRSRTEVALQLVRLPENSHQVDEFRRLWRIPGVDAVRIKEDEIGVEGVGTVRRGHGKSTRKNPCYFLWQGPVYIEENGDVFPCCHAWTSEPVGNVREHSLGEIWNNDKMRAMRRAHAAGRPEAIAACAGCLAPRPRLPLIVGSYLVNSLRVRHAIPFVERLALRYGVSLFEERQ